MNVGRSDQRVERDPTEEIRVPAGPETDRGPSGGIGDRALGDVKGREVKPHLVGVVRGAVAVVAAPRVAFGVAGALVAKPCTSTATPAGSPSGAMSSKAIRSPPEVKTLMAEDP